MLWHPADAEDATQEILVRIVTRLDSFRGEAAFTTWAYRVAANHLLTTRRRRAEEPVLTFAEFGDDLQNGLDTPYDAGGVDEGLLAQEVKLGCTNGMLLCLDRDHRIAYVLGDVFELPGEQAAEVLGVEPAAYRKRLSRARERLRAFLRGHCGLVDPANPCRCRRRVGHAIEAGRVDTANLLFARGDVGRGVTEMDRLHDAAALMRSHPAYRAPERVTAWLTDALAAGKLELASVDRSNPGPGQRREHQERGDGGAGGQ
jgi:RNA polymerase sigma factor (sigma-70 family)